MFFMHYVYMELNKKIFLQLNCYSLLNTLFDFTTIMIDVLIRDGRQVCCSGYRWNTTTNVCDGKYST